MNANYRQTKQLLVVLQNGDCRDIRESRSVGFFAAGYLNQEEFEKAISYLQKVDRNIIETSDIERISSLTRFAQAYFEVKDFKNTIRILEEKKNPFNHVDHELYVRSLTELKEEEKLFKAIASKKRFEQSVLLPDLKVAAKIYQEDGDEGRAHQVRRKISQIEEQEEIEREIQ